MLIILFLVPHSNFLFVPCGRLSCLPVSFLLHVKYPLSYRIVKWRLLMDWIKGIPNVWLWCRTWNYLPDVRLMRKLGISCKMLTSGLLCTCSSQTIISLHRHKPVASWKEWTKILNFAFFEFLRTTYRKIWSLLSPGFTYHINWWHIYLSGHLLLLQLQLLTVAAVAVVL